MLRTTRLLIRFGLAAVLVLSFAATGYLPTLDDDGDENIGMSMVMTQAGSEAGHPSNPSARKADVSPAAASVRSARSSAASLTLVTPALLAPNAASATIPLRT